MNSAACVWTFVVILDIFALSLAARTYRAAILEHRVTHKSTRQETIDDSLESFAGNASVAAKQGASIIVFPEYAIGQMGALETRENLSLIAQEVPDPQEVSWAPCNQSYPHASNIRVLVKLSCIARDNGIAVIGNLVSRVPCNSTTDEKCPADNQFYYSTNVIFAKNGTLVGRYWKHHPFREYNLDAAPREGFTVVDLGFAKFGTVACFDLMFFDPMMEYVTLHGVKNILYPTNWVGNLPLIGSVQTFASTAHGLGINLLVANLHMPEFGGLGSGIYSGSQGAITEFNDLSMPYKLLIADVPVEPEPNPSPNTIQCPSWVKGNPCRNFNPQSANHMIEEGASQFVQGNLPSSKPTSTVQVYWYTPLENSAFVYLEEDAAKVTLCQEGTCCHLDYDFSIRDESIHYALAAFEGYFSEELPFYMQSCILVRCESRNISACGKIPEGETSTRFSYLKLSGDFNAEQLFPNILSTKLENIKPDQWEFNKAKSCPEKQCKRSSGSITVDPYTEDPIFAMRILGRIYERDGVFLNTEFYNSSPVLSKFSLQALLSIFLIVLLFYRI